MEVRVRGGPARVRRGHRRGGEDGARRQAEQGHRAAAEPPRAAGGGPLRRRRRAVHGAASSSRRGDGHRLRRRDRDASTWTCCNHIAEDYIPVVASVGADAEGNSYNVNADAAAAAVAAALRRLQGRLPDRRRGLARRARRPGAAISEATAAEVRERLGEVSGGMRPKLEACVARARRRAWRGAHRRRPPAALAAARAVHRRGHRDQAVAASRSSRRSSARRVMATYARNPVEFVRGEGTRLWDDEGNEYLDFLAGISVVQLGHCHPRVVEAVREQAGAADARGQPLLHGARDAAGEAAVGAARSAARSFFCNSGAEAIECALKLARKRRPGGELRGACEGGFHGRTMGALSATPQEAKQAPFAPLVPGFRVVPRERPATRSRPRWRRHGGRAARADPGRVAASTRSTADVLRGRARGLRRARRAADLRRDPVRHGPHRHDVGARAARRAPDVMTVAKGLGGGLPVGACVTTRENASVLEPGDHGSTFAGGPVIAAGRQRRARRGRPATASSTRWAGSGERLAAASAASASSRAGSA